MEYKQEEKNTLQCFLCARFAKAEDLDLFRNKRNGIRRWFHNEKRRAACITNFPGIKEWEPVDASLGETTYEEEMKLAGLS